MTRALAFFLALTSSLAHADPPPEDFTVAPSRIAEARTLVPGPLLYGTFRPELGRWVEYTLEPGTTKVRAAVTGRIEDEGAVRWQLEFLFSTDPRTVIALTIAEHEPRGTTANPSARRVRYFVERLVAVAGAQPPVSIPVDLFPDAPELRGEEKSREQTRVSRGPFAGAAERVRYRLSDAQPSVTTSAKVPLFGVARLESDGVKWEAVATGTDAVPALTQVPLIVPRLPETSVDVP